METSILKSTKKVLGVGDDDDSFDLDILTHINSAFSVLHQLGVGPDAGFMIEDDEVEWDALIAANDRQLNLVKTIVYLRVRMLFDPPTTSYLITALEKQIVEHEWRLNVGREETEWVDPDPDLVVVEDEIIDGGDAG